MLKILFKLQVTLFKAIEVIIEREQSVKVITLVSLNLFCIFELTLLNLLLLNVIDCRAETGCFGELIFKIFQLVRVLGVIKVHCGLKLFNL